MVQIASSSFDDDVKVVAFINPDTGDQSIVLINSVNAIKSVQLYGSDLPDELRMYRTTVRDKCSDVGAVSPGESFSLYGESINTITTIR